MIYQIPVLSKECTQVIDNINQLRERLKFSTTDSLNRWKGSLARMAYARAIHGSNTMEGIKVTLNDAVAAVDGEEPLNPKDENWLALVGYREAMDYIIQLAKEPKSYDYSEGTILGMHFMMMKYDLSKNPGRWRPGYVNVTNSETNQVVYEGPDAKLVPALMGELIAFLNHEAKLPVVIKAAMAHLNLTMIHPFKDGNGRMARVIQSMVLAKEGGILSPVFSNIEEYIGKDTLAYYSALAEVGKGSWHPENNALPWIKYCLTAHYSQAMTLLNRMTIMSNLIQTLNKEVENRKLNDRVIWALIDACIGLKVQNPTYRKQAEITEQVAKLDLQSMVSGGLLIAKGERRWRHYVASEYLMKLRDSIEVPQPPGDPFAKTSAEPKQGELPGIALSSP
jgi:Fic family protein